eukprot:8035203-Prorocentrum_lima.AAC.1
MTSSLVGSEMCIRDRSTRIVEWKAPQPPPPPRQLQQPPCAPQVQQGCAPVSYTHLTLPTICSV